MNTKKKLIKIPMMLRNFYYSTAKADFSAKRAQIVKELGITDHIWNNILSGKTKVDKLQREKLAELFNTKSSKIFPEYENN